MRPTTTIPPVPRHRSTYSTVLGRVRTGARRGAPGPVSRPPVMPRQVGLDPTGKGHSPRSHTPSPMSQDGAARQGRGTAPRAQGLASIWPSPPSEHVRGHATGGQKSSELPTGSACPGPGHPLTLTRRATTGPFVLWSPLCSILSPACPRAKGGFPEGSLNGLALKHPVGGTCCSWPGPQRPQRGRVNDPLEMAPDRSSYSKPSNLQAVQWYSGAGHR